MLDVLLLDKAVITLYACTQTHYIIFTHRDETGIKRQEAGIKRQETGIKRQETGIKRQETGIKRQETGIKRQETGIKRQEKYENSLGERKCYLGTDSSVPSVKFRGKSTADLFCNSEISAYWSRDRVMSLAYWSVR